MNVIRLDPPIWLHTPKGTALAYFLIIETEMDDQWKCVQHDTGEWWTWNNEDVRAVKNITLGRMKVSPIERKL